MNEFVSNELYKSVFNSPTGEKILADLSARFYDIPSYTQNDPHQTSFNEGKRAVIRYVLTKLAQTIQLEEEEQDGI